MNLFSAGFELVLKLVLNWFLNVFELVLGLVLNCFLFVIGFETEPMFERSREKIRSKRSQQERGPSLDHAATWLVKSRAQIKIKYETERYDIMVL